MTSCTQVPPKQNKQTCIPEGITDFTMNEFSRENAETYFRSILTYKLKFKPSEYIQY